MKNERRLMGVYRGRSRSATVGWEPEERFSDMVKEEKKKLGKNKTHKAGLPNWLLVA
jgi:hypothetical protein